jgi:hypothetical protein
MTTLRKATALVAILCAPGMLLGQSATCASYSYSFTSGPTPIPDSTQRVTGTHGWNATPHGSCTYSGDGKIVPCYAVCNASTDTSNWENGVTAFDVLGIPWVHVVSSNGYRGLAVANGGTSCGSTGAAAVRSCLIATQCAINITFS